jgi:hypothetical protein
MSQQAISIYNDEQIVKNRQLQGLGFLQTLVGIQRNLLNFKVIFAFSITKL